MRRMLVTSTLAVMILSACGGHSAQSGHDRPAPTSTPTVTPTQTVSPNRGFPAYAVTARKSVHRVAIHARPGGRVVRHLTNPQPLGVPLTFLLRHRTLRYLQVYLPVRPDGSTGWVKARDMAIAGVPFRVDIHRGAHRLDLYKYGALVKRFPIGVGTTDTPTPGGIYYLKELLRPPDPKGFYGPYAFGLSGFSTVLHSFAGGSGVIGIHGTSDPASIGRSESHGCIRMRNSDITYLAHRLPLGTPVRILH